MYITLLIILLALGTYFLLKKSRNANIPAGENYRALLQAHVALYRRLDAEGKTKFEALVNTFLQDTRIEGVGTEVTPLDRALIAAGAVIPIFGFPGWRYKNLTNVILYPDTFD